MKVLFIVSFLMMSHFPVTIFLVGSSKSIKLIDLLPASPDKTAIQDYTPIIQKALNKYDTLYFPPFPLRISRNGISLRSNQVLYFAKGSKLIMEANGLSQNQVISIKDVNNVKIYNLNIQGDRKIHTGKGGEWGMGISILGSKNIYLYNSVINNCWGDGIYIGESRQLSYSDGVYVINSLCEKNRRNGVSIISGKNISIIGSTFSNSDGTAPMCGIAIEPNHSGNVLQNILLENDKTIMNPNCGIAITLDKWDIMNKSSNSVNVEKNISIKIVNHVDAGSKNSLFLMTNNGGNKHAIRTAEIIKGSITVINPKWNPNLNPVNSENYANYGPKVDIQISKSIRAKFTTTLKTALNKTAANNQSNIKIHYN